MRASSARRCLPRFLFPEGTLPGGKRSDFGLNNLPYGVFRPKGGGCAAAAAPARAGVALGDRVLDLRALVEKGLLPERSGLTAPTLNAFMAAGPEVWKEVRHELQQVLLADGHPKSLAAAGPGVLEEVVHAQADVTMLMPADVGDYTDFYASREHATNVGVMFRGKDNALQPNWLHLPVGYHGRASSVVVSGTGIRRPSGQMVPKGQDKGPPVFGACKALDIELEMGCFVGPGNDLGRPIPLAQAEEHIFGLVLLNDWSARDIQKWEYVPLGPFLGKSFGTSISPWVVPLAALEPFRTPTPAQEDPEPLPYLRQAPGSKQGFDVSLEVGLQASGMSAPETVSRSNVKHMYWSMAQQLAHHTVNGCAMRPGDLLGTGTISGPTEDSYGSFLELTWGGSKEIELQGGAVKRKYLQDGDRVVIRGACEAPDGTRVGFGECVGEILPAL
mmetsp:Transcript_102674/g.316828  ORF Transcript_102674/g.316828 Transcript_102674/m.316828 type:complete len:445 (+) Transcript_102674:84-1418(+)